MNKPRIINIMSSNDRRTKEDVQSSLDQAIEQARELGAWYTLITIGDNRHDPWVIAQAGMAKDKDFSPLIAVNPFYQHPLTIAKRLTSLKSIYSNRIGINLVSGSFFGEMLKLGDTANADIRNERLTEFNQALQTILFSNGPSHFQGKHFSFKDVHLFPKLPNIQIDFFLSGLFSEEKSEESTRNFYVRNIRPGEEIKRAKKNFGLSFGICARSTEVEARADEGKIFPLDRKGQMLAEIASANTQTPWSQWVRKNHQSTDTLFSLQAVNNFWSSAPYMVGSYKQVSDRIREYKQLGYEFFLVDFKGEDLPHVKETFRQV